MRRSHWSLPLVIALGILLAACQTPGSALLPTAAAPAVSSGAESPDDLPDESLVQVMPTIAPLNEPTPSPVPETATPAPTQTPLPTATPEPSPTPEGPGTYTYEVVATFPHDANAWTQGLVIDNGTLFEGTGQWGVSNLREVNLESGAILRSVPLDGQYFGEGITVLGDRIFQLTWQEGTGFVYDRNTFQQLQTFTYPTEGWGITDDGERLIVSDGTSTLYFWDPETLTEIGRIQVSDQSGQVNRLNELEYIDGEIWANIWLEDRIARISPETGEVTGWIDMSGLLDTANLEQPADVLNGIAYDEATGRLFVTGKLWPSLFEIRVVPTP